MALEGSMQAATKPNSTGVWQFLREALEGTTQDFTEGSLSRGIALLAVPTVLEMAMESTFGLVDAFWVARLGADALAAVGLTESLLVLLFSIALGLSMAATATVARRIGEKDAEGASLAAVQAIGSAVLVALATGVAGALFARQLLGLMTVCERVFRNIKFELPSTKVRRFVVTRELVDDPAAELRKILSDPEREERIVTRQLVDEYARRFRQTYGMTLRFTDAAADMLIKEALEKGQSVRDLCATRFKDFQFGLKLIAQNSGQQEFVIDTDAVQAPDKVLSDWVVASYRK